MIAIHAKIAGDVMGAPRYQITPVTHSRHRGDLSKSVVPRYEKICPDNDQHNTLFMLMPEYRLGTSR